VKKNSRFKQILKMKTKLLQLIVIVTHLMILPNLSFGQIIPLGTAENFVLFSTAGAVSNTGITHLTGNVGTNSGSSTGFGNVNGTMNDGDGISAQCAVDVQLAYNTLNSTIPTFFPAPLLGNGQILVPGVYSIGGPATLNLGLTLDAQNNPNAVFIIQIAGAFSTNAASKVYLVNGAQACNVFWKVEGLVDMAVGTTMRGTIIANNAAINMNAGDTLEGRALSIAGAITVNNVLAYTPIGCGSPVLLGPIAPPLGNVECFTIFSSDGPVTNVGVTNVVGDVGTNLGSTLGFNPLLVVGAIHGVPDGATAAAATDLLGVYTYLNTLPYDIELLYPAQFGNNLVLTPHVYLMNAAVTFTDTLYLDAQGNSNAVFVIQVNGAFSTSTFSKVNLINGTLAKNVFWKIDGAVEINDFSIFKGTIVANNGAIELNTGVNIEGRALTTTGALATAAITATMPPGCGGTTSPIIVTDPTDQTVCIGNSVSFVVSATGTNLTYQWRLGTTNLVDGGSISGSQTNTLTINPAALTDAANNYNVVVSGTFSPSVTSSNVTLTVTSAPTITLQPTDQIGCVGDSLSLVVAATGSGLSYQWAIGTNDILGATNDTLTFDPATILDNALDYNVTVSIGNCSITSNDASVTINTVSNITLQPANQTACVGDSVSFTVAATGTGLTYQWNIGTNPILGATNDILTFDPATLLDNALNYNVTVLNGLCSVTSNNASLTVISFPVITLQPANQIGCVGDSISIVVSATGSNLTYQWSIGTNDILGATNDTLTFDPASTLDNALNYNVTISSGNCSVTSNDASITINTTPSITLQPANQTACLGDSISFTVTATGTGLTYQWNIGTNPILGATNDILTIDPVIALSALNNYNVTVSNGVCSVTSNNASLTLNTAPIITLQPSSQTICEGDSVSFIVSATGSGLSYQWRIGSANITGATNDTLTFDPSTIANGTSNYNVVVTGTCSPSVTSVDVSLTVNPTPIAVATTISPVCVGDTVFLLAQQTPLTTYNWSGPNGFVSAIQNPFIANATLANSGNYVLTTTANGCTSQPDIVTVSVIICTVDLSVVKTVDNMTPVVGSTVTFTIIAENNGSANATGVTVSEIIQSGYTFVSSSTTTGTYNDATGIWTIGNLNSSDADTLTIIVTVNATGDYSNTVTIIGNENDVDLSDNSVTIETFPTDFHIPEGFSPNGDGINDLFIIRGIASYPENNFVIFNRWGNKVFEATPYQNTWDGTSTLGITVGDDKLPTGTYFYIIDLGDGTDAIKGTIYLTR
jgi:gliding motility-associated-like protein/uncharacterized repeat protein (TIGR01451 family)